MTLLNGLRLVRMQTTHPRSNSVIGPLDFLKEEAAAKAASDPPGQLVTRRRSKPERCSQGIFVVRCPARLLSRDSFCLVALLLPLRKATIQINRLPLSRAHSALGALLDSCLTNHALASPTRWSHLHRSA